MEVYIGLSIELQIWRPGSEDGVFFKVGSTTIVTEESQTELYQCPLASPMTFQSGDVLGYYQPDSQLSIYLVVALDEGQLEHLYSSESATSQLN